MDVTKEAQLKPRENGERMLPKFLAETSCQRIDQETSGFHQKVEAGYGTLGLEFKRSGYSEKTSKDQLEILQIHGLYRMSFTERSGMSLGIGSMI